MMRLVRSSKGFSFLPVLVLTAVLGGITVMMTSVTDDLTSIMSQTAETREVEVVVKQVEALVSQRARCGDAFKNNAGGAPVAATVASANEIWAGDTAAANLLVGQGSRIGGPNSSILVSRVALMGPLQANGYPVAGSAPDYVMNGGARKTFPGPTGTYWIRTGVLAIEFDRAAATGASRLGGVLRPRYVPVLIGENTATGVIDDCPGANFSAANEDCATIMAANQPAEYNTCRTRACALAAAGHDSCHIEFRVKGFDAQGRPLCSCTPSCTPIIPQWEYTGNYAPQKCSSWQRPTYGSSSSDRYCPTCVTTPTCVAYTYVIPPGYAACALGPGNYCIGQTGQKCVNTSTWLWEVCKAGAGTCTNCSTCP